ncbi:MAG TPA: diaminobutyrate--2-oxoglutarate transaminase family protein [Actinophytocola sp.]|uniref:aspartate aminotransferase family protein n=1 Tax=Actinophytocola sp. TaxID=1872138 RepID=UPI002DBF785C|nr:diaminobutyrate--2-oxoglutarate transaminase family protein [Actinophytocola sp.]HEU5471243.1 diaminobutyrate--2-oxoglutarate transaminase family protein [Actinophytocola sp.]
MNPIIRTQIPGPRSREYLGRQARFESSARTYPRNLPIAVRRASGSFLEDVDGNVFIDFLAGAGVLSLGHGHPEIVRVVAEQLGEYVHGLDFPTPVKDVFTRRQLDMLPAGMRDRMKIHFCGPTGANGVEAAIKLAKMATGRGDVAAFHGAFHGSTAGAMAVSGSRYPKDVVANGMPGVHFFPYPGCGRCPLGLTPDTCDTNCATYLERVLTDDMSGIAHPAAVLIELVQGEGGGIPARPEFVRRLREITTRLEIPLIVDEVQTGCGRTGTWFAFERFGIEPDIVVASKALSGIGLPVSMIIYDRAMDRWAPGAHIGTFRGNQLAFAAGVAALDIIERDAVLDNVLAREAQLSARLAELAERSPWVREVRGMGLMWAVELADPVTGAPAGEFARDVQLAALCRGLIVERGGRGDAVVRMLPPLNVAAEVVDLAADILTAAVLTAETGAPVDGEAAACSSPSPRSVTPIGTS